MNIRTSFLPWSAVLGAALWLCVGGTAARADEDPCERITPVDVAGMSRFNARIQEIMPQLNAIRDGRKNSEMSVADQLKARPLELEVCGLVSQAMLAARNFVVALRSPACATSKYRADIKSYEDLVKDDLQGSFDIACYPR